MIHGKFGDGNLRSDFWRKWQGKVVRSLKIRGGAGTILLAIAFCKSLLVKQCIRCLTRNPWNPWYQFLDRRYDRRFGVDTAGIDFIPAVLSLCESANVYSPTTRSTFVHVMRRLDIDHSRFVFIDFGCGKGKTLLLAAESPFKRVIGIEISPRLARIAEENIKSYNGKRACAEIGVVCTDATGYVSPREPAVYYLYDPFKRDVMAVVLENIQRSLVESPREIYIVYLEPSWQSLLDGAAFLVPVKQTSRYCIYRARGA